MKELIFKIEEEEVKESNLNLSEILKQKIEKRINDGEILISIANNAKYESINGFKFKNNSGRDMPLSNYLKNNETTKIFKLDIGLFSYKLKNPYDNTLYRNYVLIYGIKYKNYYFIYSDSFLDKYNYKNYGIIKENPNPNQIISVSHPLLSDIFGIKIHNNIVSLGNPIRLNSLTNEFVGITNKNYLKETMELEKDLGINVNLFRIYFVMFPLLRVLIKRAAVYFREFVLYPINNKTIDCIIPETYKNDINSVETIFKFENKLESFYNIKSGNALVYYHDSLENFLKLKTR